MTVRSASSPPSPVRSSTIGNAGLKGTRPVETRTVKGVLAVESPSPSVSVKLNAMDLSIVVEETPTDTRLILPPPLVTDWV